jgi:3-isopropylmalate/(R)-2-methylmalate dehydratase small subunit
MRASGITCVLGKSFARIFYRNCINLGMLVVVCSEAVDAAIPGSRVEIDTERGTVVVDGASFQARPVPPFMQQMLASGGLVEWRRKGGRRAAAS